jgi:carboxymethylenebutenolidase
MLKNDLVLDGHALLDAPQNGRPAPSRRAALKAGLGVGYAAATLPIMAQTAIQTPADGLTAGAITIDVAGFKMPAYRAQPAGKTGLPVALVISEIFGVHEYIADTARRLARQGYLAIAPELFVRQGDARSQPDIATLMSEIISQTPDAQVMRDLDAAVAWATANGGNTRKLGITGFCWGGRVTWLYAAHNPKIKAGVAWYGRLVGQPSELAPKNPVDLAGQLHGPVLGLYGGADTGIPVTSINQMKDALAKAGAHNRAARESQFVLYPGTPHAFHADYRPSYRKGPAEDGWKRALAWFQQHGVA